MSAIQGKRIIYLYRILKDAATDDAKALAFTTENERTKSRDADTTETKDGPIRTPGALETEITTTAIFSSESDEMIAKLEKAVDDSEKVEIWEVNLDKPGTSDNVGKFAAKYFQGYPSWGSGISCSSRRSGIGCRCSRFGSRAYFGSYIFDRGWYGASACSDRCAD